MEPCAKDCAFAADGKACPYIAGPESAQS